MATFQRGKTDSQKLISGYIDALGLLGFHGFWQVSRTLDRIPNLPKRLLALRGYLKREKKSPGRVRDRWAFTQQQFDDFSATAAGELLTRELRAVKRRFKKLTDDEFRLGNGSKFRSLDTQVKYWNGRSNVQQMADQLMEKMNRKVKKRMQEKTGSFQIPTYPTIGDYADRTQLQFKVAIPPAATLRNPNSPEAPRLSAEFQQLQSAFEDFSEQLCGIWLKGELKTSTPGISHHGQAHAIDFGIRENKKGGKKLVGASNAAKWKSSGFGKLLEQAMRGSKHFHGPLKHPNEPWHWEFH